MKKIIEYIKRYIAEEKKIRDIETILLSNIDYSIAILSETEADIIEKILLKKGSDKNV
jgi:hypothetical protein